MRDRTFTIWLAFVLFFSILLAFGLCLTAHAQNMSRTRGHNKAADRWAQINFCMRLPDIKDVQACVEMIK